MTAKEFIYNEYPHLTHPLEGENPLVDFKLTTLIELFEKYKDLCVANSPNITITNSNVVIKNGIVTTLNVEPNNEK